MYYIQPQSTKQQFNYSTEDDTIVVVPGQDTEVVGQREDEVVHPVVQFASIAALEVCASAASNKERVASESEAVLVVHICPSHRLTIEYNNVYSYADQIAKVQNRPKERWKNY